MSSDALGTAGGVVSAQDHRLAIGSAITSYYTGALDVRTGVFPSGTSLALIAGTSATGTMTVTVSPFQAATARTSAQGAYLGPTFESSTTLNIAAAPASNSRIDVVYVKQQDADATVLTPDGSTGPLLAVATGTAAASPVKATIPVGALELGTVTVAAGATSTNGAGVTISNTARQTVMAGGVMSVRSTATDPPAYDGHTRYMPGKGLQVGVGGAWGPPVNQLPICQTKQDTTQIIPLSVWTSVTFDNETIDTDGMHSNSTNNTRINCTAAGYYSISGAVPFLNPPGTSTVRVGARLLKNGTALDSGSAYATVQAPLVGCTAVTPTLTVQLAAGDYIELQAWQEFTSTGGGLNTRIASDQRANLSVNCLRLI